MCVHGLDIVHVCECEYVCVCCCCCHCCEALQLERLVCGLIGNSGQSGEGLWHQVGRLHDDHGDDDPVLYNVKSNNSIDKGKSLLNDINHL